MGGAALGLLGIPVALVADRWPAQGAVLGVGLALALVWHLWQRPFEGAYALIALAPLTDLAEVVPGSGVRLSYVALAGAVAGGVWALARRRERLGGAHWVLAALAAPAVAGLLSIPLSVDPARSALYSGRLLLLWVAVAVVALSMRSTADVRSALGTVAALGVALTSVALAQLAFPGAGIGRAYVPTAGNVLGLLRPAAFFMDPNFLGGFLAMGALVAAAIAVWSGRRGGLVWGACAIASAFGMAITLSRSAWVGFAAGAMTLVALAPRARRLAVGGALATFAVAAAIAVPGTVERFAAGVDRSARIRVELASAELAIATQRPVTGTGLATFGRVYEEAGGSARTGRILDPHQVPLTVAAETGAVGVAAMAAVLAGLAAAAIRRRRLGWEPEDAAVAVALVALSVQALFQNYTYFEPLWLTLALAAAATTRASGEAV